MTFVKGHSGFKPKGQPNKRTAEVLRSIESVLSKLDTTIEQDIEELSPKDRAKMWYDLQEYIRPKQARVEIQAEVEQKTESIEVTINHVNARTDDNQLPIS